MLILFSLTDFTRVLSYVGRPELWHLNCVYFRQIVAEQDFMIASYICQSQSKRLIFYLAVGTCYDILDTSC